MSGANRRENPMPTLYDLAMMQNAQATPVQTYIDTCCRRLVARGFQVTQGPNSVVIARRRKFELTRLTVVDRLVFFTYRPDMDMLEFNQYANWCKSTAKDMTGGAVGFLTSMVCIPVAIVDQARPEVMSLAQQQPSLGFGTIGMPVVRDLTAGMSWYFRGMPTIGWAYAKGNRNFVEQNLL
jgi:hypothetical protein